MFPDEARLPSAAAGTRDPGPGIGGKHDAATAAGAFRWRTRVYWEDTDAGGVVYHAGYLRFLERARTEWMRAAALGQDAMRRTYGIVFVVRELSIAFDKPARLDDELDTTVAVVRQRSASIDLAQAVIRAADGVTLARAAVKVACVDAGSFVPRRLPADVVAIMAGSDSTPRGEGNRKA